jgi:hypothetical protein
MTVKFLCVPCDVALKLEQVRGPDRGSVSLVYACPSCGYEVAMLTNPQETQLVSSLGVKLGPAGASSGSAAAVSKCPFTGMVRELGDAPAPAGGPAGEGGLSWTPAAEARLAALPEFVRPMVRMGIERFARERGHAAVDEGLLEQARTAMGLPG